MTKPNINIPTAFAINGTKTDFSQAKITDGFDRLQPDVLPGDNLNKFIDDTYKGLNGVLELYEGCVLYDSTVAYTNTSIVFYINSDDEVEVYRSLINNNLNNPLTDTTAWEKVEMGGGGTSRNIGEIVASTIPLTDAGLHLLDGALIDGYGIYSAFVEYIASIYDASASYFCTEAQWQTSVNTYGVCGKFVYDSVNNTVRLPKVTGILEGTTDVTALGDLVEAGLPNITGEVAFKGQAGGNQYQASGAFSYIEYGNAGSDQGKNAYWRADFNASRSSSIYGNSSTVQPQTIKCHYYIVIATSTKTDIQVDIDEIATDLNSKADVDLSNVPSSKGILTESYINGTSWYRIYSDGWCEQGGTIDNVGTSSTPIAGNTIILLKAYTNANYTVIIGGKDNRYASSVQPGVRVVDGTSFAILTGGDAVRFYWQACGYIR